jgi:uncharacterized protein YaaR (DUF327 family)
VNYDSNAIVAFAPHLLEYVPYATIRQYLFSTHISQKKDGSMRIRNASNVKDVDHKVIKSTASKQGSSRLFAATLNQKQDDIITYKQEIEELKREIEYAGDTLEKQPTLVNFHKFRGLLGQIAKRISAEAYKLIKIGGTPQNPRYFEIITVINSEADQLYKLLLQEQQDHMTITAKVIGIKGLIIDLTT